MTKRLLAAALVLLGAGLVGATVFLVRLRSTPPPPPYPTSGLTRVALPPPLHEEVEALRGLKKAGGDRYSVEEAGEALEERLARLLPLLRGPSRAATAAGALPTGEASLFEDSFWTLPLVPSGEERIHAAAGVEAFAGAFPASPAFEPGPPPPPAPPGALRGPRSFFAEAARLIAPLEALDSAAIKVVHLEGSPGGPLAAEVLYTLAGRGPDGRRLQWNGRWSIVLGKGLGLAAVVPREATRVALAGPAFEDVSWAALGRNASYALQLRPSLDHFRDRLDAATGIDVYGHHGIAVGDVDGDGREDVYLPEPPGLPAILLHNEGDGTFRDISAGSGADVLDGASQALLLDLDGDGDQDLFLVVEDGVRVLKNDGRGRFAHHPTGLGELEEARATPMCAAAADYDGDGAVDVYVGSYVFWRGASDRTGSRLPFPYHDARNGAPNFLLRNLGDGSFRDVTRESGLAEGNDRFTFACAWGDYDADGDPDLAVANDFGRKNLYRNAGDGTFQDVAGPAGASDLGAGMSAAWEDYDGDGLLDLYFGNMFSTAGLRVTTWSGFRPGSPRRGEYQKHARGNTLLRNRGDGSFEDVSLATRSFMGRWAWSSDFLDFDLDGREDIYIAAGFVTNPDTHDL